MKILKNVQGTIKTLFIAGFMAITVLACSEKKPAEEASEASEETETEAGLDFTNEQLSAIGVKFGAIEKKNLTSVIKASGNLEVPPQNKALVNVISGGIIKRIFVMEGQRVRKGELLATVENQDLVKLQQDYLASKGGFTFVSAEFERQKMLKEAGAGTGKSYQLAQANFNAETSKIKAMESQLKQFGISASKVASGNISLQYSISAPISGTVGTITTETGAFAQPGTALMPIVDNSRIYADLIVFEKDLGMVSIGQSVAFQLTNQSNAEIKGKIYGINKSFENDSKGVIVHANITKPSTNLIPGMYVTGLISTGSSLVDAVPVDAVVHAEGRDFIFVAMDQEAKPEQVKGKAIEEEETKTHFEKIEVRKGVSELGYVQITPLKSVPAQSRIVIKGAFYLQSKSAGPGEEE